MKHVNPAELASAEPISSGKPKPTYYMPPTVRWDFETAIQADRELTFAAVKAAHVLLDCYNHHDGCAWPSAETIAERIGVTRSTASEAVNKLKARGWFKIEAVRQDNRQGSNRYFPCLDKVGLSVGPGRHSEGFSIGSDEPQRRPEPRVSVGSDRSSASATADTNPAREPRKETHQSEPSGARARELPSSFREEGNRRKPQADKVPFPDDYRFPPEAEAAARAKGLTDGDIAKAVEAYRKAVGTELRTRDHLDRGGAGYLRAIKVRPVDHLEVVTVRDPMGGEFFRPLRFLDPGTPYIRKDGSKGKVPGKAAPASSL